MKKNLKMRCKRSFALLLALAICLGTTPSMAFAADDVVSGNEDGGSGSGNEDGSAGSGNEGGSTEGGNTEGGNTEGGNTEGGNTEGGNTEGGNTEGGNTEGGNTEGGNTEGGNTEGGNTEGGNTEDGNTEGRTSDEGTSSNDPSDDTNAISTHDDLGSEISDEWDITKTERPAASDTVTTETGTKDDKAEKDNKEEGTEVPAIQGTDWTIFYDADKDVYKVTFNIGADAENTQVIDLTQALELLGQYAETGKQELQAAIDALGKPVMEDVGNEPIMQELPAKPDAPAGFEGTEPVAPVEPGKPEGLDEALGKALTGFTDMVLVDSDILYNSKSAINYLESQGFNVDDAYIRKYAEFLMSAADNANDKKVIATGEPVGYYNWLIEYLTPSGTWAADGSRVTYTMEQRREMAIADLEKDTPVTPEYFIDKSSDAYKAYEEAMRQYERDKAAYDAAFDAYMTEHGPESDEGRAYAEEMEKYNAAVAEIKAEYEAALAAYKAKLAEAEANYANNQAAYDAAVAKLKADYDRQNNANVLEPGDVKKFELNLTSDSKHTYKYQSGSFTLATPGWTVDPNGNIVGFDGQILPDEYVDRNDYYVTVTAKPLQDLFKAIGMDDPTNPLNKWNLNGNGEVALSRDGKGNITGYMGYWDAEIKKALAEYPGETLEERLNAYILAYYGNEYDSIDALIQGNPDAAAELTKTTTSGNKWFSLGDYEKFKVDAHAATVKYDHFYKNLFSFAFGDETDIDKILGEAKFNEATNRWEYENDSWTDNKYQLALYYYMDHKDIWQQTDAYFSALLDGGLTTEQATWTSLMMALNIDGELTGNDWQNTKWPWYNSIKLEQMDIDFTLTKKDGEGETITSSETEFQVYYIDKVKKEDGTTTDVMMYCVEGTDEEGNVSYTFVTTESTVWTKNGELNINYAMMKDIVYYLLEMTAPEGYERDTNVYIVMNEEDYNKLSDEDKAALEGTFDKFLNLSKSDDGLEVSTDFINVKIIPPPGTPNNPPSPPSRPRRDRDRTSIPDEPTPQTSIPEAPVPLASIPDEDVPLTVLLDEDVPLASVPKTGDISTLWYALLALSGIGLLGMAAINAKKSKESAND